MKSQSRPKMVQVVFSIAAGILIVSFQNCTLENQFQPMRSQSGSSQENLDSNSNNASLVTASPTTYTCQITAQGTVRLTEDCYLTTNPNIRARWSPDIDSGDAVIAAMNAIHARNAGTLIFPTGPGLVNRTIEINSSYVGLKCAGGDRSCMVIMSHPDKPQVLVSKYRAAAQTFGAPDGIYNLNISGLYFNRMIPNGGIAIKGGDGIVLSGYVDRSTLDNLVVVGSYDNIVFGPASTSTARAILTMNAVHDNVVFRPQPGHSGSIMQWDLIRFDAAGAGRFGFYASDDGATEGGGLGQWVHVQTYANGQGSFWAIAKNHAISGVRADSSWFCCSLNAFQEVYLDLKGGINNHMSGTSIELSSGFGLHLTSGVSDFNFSGGKVYGSKKSGIFTLAKKFNLSGSTLMWNGNDSTQAHRNGIEIVSGDAVISGLSSYQNSGYGISIASDSVYFAAGDLSENLLGPLLSVVNLESSSFCSVKALSGRCKP